MPSNGSGAANASAIVSASENFITLFDAVRMNILSKDTLHPILVDTIQAVNKVTDRDFENKGKIVQYAHRYVRGVRRFPQSSAF